MQTVLRVAVNFVLNKHPNIRATVILLQKNIVNNAQKPHASNAHGDITRPVTNTYCQTERQHRREVFLSGVTINESLGPERARMEGFTPEILPFNVSFHLWEHVELSV